MPRSASRFASALALAVFGAGAHAAELTVSAAASLTNAFKEVAAAYEARHPGAKVLLNFGASGALLQQIAKGAPVDVFASADQETMDQAQQRQLVDASARRDFVRNTLVVIVPADAPSPPENLAELAQPRMARIAIGMPASVPAGRYTKAALEKAHLWKSIEPRMIGAISVRQVLDYVARSEVDAGVVYATDAALMPRKVKVAFPVPTETPVRYPIAPVVGSPLAPEAAKFVGFVLSPPAQAILAKHGFARL